EIKRENKLSHCTYSASRFVYEVPGPIGPGYSPFAPSALRKTSPNSLWDVGEDRSLDTNCLGRIPVTIRQIVD
ncbi:MAG TPA: hypothetical protein VGX93_05210, partial [Chthoniobacterales bacterium]|nr:hypothetical protein [Chthoniobacterales bacterium]